MKSAVRRKQHQDALRKKILDAARELFVAEGVEAVSMRKIADKIGYSATTLYNHFDDKEALLRACAILISGARGIVPEDRAHRRPDRAAAPAGAELYRICPQVFESVPLYVHDSAIHYHDDESCQDIEPGGPDKDAYCFLRMTVVEALAAGAFRDEYDDPDLVSQIVWSAVHGVAALHLIMGHDDTKVKWLPAQEVAQASIEVLLSGLVRPAAVTKANDRGRHA